MEDNKNIRDTGKNTLKDYIRLTLAFYGCLMLLGIYQQARLFLDGVVDTLVGKNLFILWTHHLGFAALISLLLVYVFKFLVSKKPVLGLRIIAGLFLSILAMEFLLTEYYITYYEIAGVGFTARFELWRQPAELFLILGAALTALGTGLYIFYRFSSRIHIWIGRMYPFTIILFTLFLGTLLSGKKPVNQNKVQHMLSIWKQQLTEGEQYEGANPYPIWDTWTPQDPLGPYIEWQESPPDIVLIMVEGLSSDFIGENSAFRAFMPFLDSLRTQGLHWNNYISNVGSGREALPVVTGSLPFGKNGFTRLEEFPARYTLFSLMKENGYYTSFQYGGNSALGQWDRFLFQERLDEITDNKSFGKEYTRQREDAAGISLGFPDQALYKRYLSSRLPHKGPSLDVFQTLSSKQPYLIPNQNKYLKAVSNTVEEQSFSARQKRFIRKNKEVFASMAYTDAAMRNFFREFKDSEKYANTLFIITGTHHPAGLRSENFLKQYKVPLVMTGPLITSPVEFNELASHLDLTPSLLGSLSSQYPLELPGWASWLGNGLLDSKKPGYPPKEIPLFRLGSGLEDYVMGDYVLNHGKAYRLSKGMVLQAGVPEKTEDSMRNAFRRFQAVNRYVTEKNALLPKEAHLYEPLIKKPSKKELVWIQSEFAGRDFDQAYLKARKLAHDGNWARALVMCNYILFRVPGHVDSEILMGRIYAWNGEYDKAEAILEGVVKKYPRYEDGYAALLDTYFWAGAYRNIQYLKRDIEKYLNESELLREKADRAMESPDPASNPENSKISQPVKNTVALNRSQT